MTPHAENSFIRGELYAFVCLYFYSFVCMYLFVFTGVFMYLNICMHFEIQDYSCKYKLTYTSNLTHTFMCYKNQNLHAYK
jgi:hypothetical protein